MCPRVLVSESIQDVPTHKPFWIRLVIVDRSWFVLEVSKSSLFSLAACARDGSDNSSRLNIHHVTEICGRRNRYYSQLSKLKVQLESDREALVNVVVRGGIYLVLRDGSR